MKLSSTTPLDDGVWPKSNHPGTATQHSPASRGIFDIFDVEPTGVRAAFFALS